VPPTAYSDKRSKVPINVDLDPRDANKIRTVAKVDGRSLPDVLGEAIRFYYAWKEWERGETYKETGTRLKPGRSVQINEALLTEEE
jgi:hypothetical protein